MLAPVQHSTPSSFPFLLPPICVCALLLGDGYKREESRGCLACPVFVVYIYFLSPPPKNVWVAMEWSQQQPPVSCLPYPSKVKDAGGTTKTFFQRHVSPCFLFLPRKHTKQQPKRVEMGFPCRLTRRYTVCQLGVPRVYSAHLSNREISRKKNMASQQRIVLLGSWDLKSICPRFLNGCSFLSSVENA
jgi:hypothetical protein